MKLQSIQIKNYRSIEDLSFEIKPLDDKTFTYGLIGVNEAGKSSILKALALKEGVVVPSQKDFRNKTKNIEVLFSYKFDDADIKKYKGLVEPTPGLDAAPLELSGVTVVVSFAFASPAQPIVSLEIQKIKPGEIESSVLTQLKTPILNDMHHSIFWTAEDRYLISQPINLTAFASDPEKTSIPLKNCFSLAGITDVKESIANLQSDSTEIEHLQTLLGEKVTEHIKAVWPNHPITITFLITNGLIHFHVKDTGTGGKAKTADQRSDGFKQFVSFLLTVSAQDRAEELSNTILLLDEPEIHLHPQAQEYLRDELIKITQNDRNNIVFFATHSNYMIDKSDLSRNFRIKKQHDKTAKDQLSKQVSTYASVTYEIFDIPSSDYHNELYAKLHSVYQDDDPADDKRERILEFDTNFLSKAKGLKKDKPWKGNPNQATLPTYIRNCIHHSDNGDKFTESELKKSIESLRSFVV